MPGTPNPTIEHLLEIYDLVNGDIGASQDEVVLRLKALLPGLINAKNTEAGWTGPLAVRVPADIQIAPAEITASHKNMVFVNLREGSRPEGIGGAFQNVWNLLITSVDSLVQTPQQIRTAWRRGECIKAIMFAFLSGCADSNGKLRWKVAEPDSLELQNDIDSNISLVTVGFTVIQPPSYGVGY